MMMKQQAALRCVTDLIVAECRTKKITGDELFLKIEFFNKRVVATLVLFFQIL